MIEQPNVATQAGLNEWRRLVTAIDRDRLPDLLAENVVYRNPASFDSYVGKPMLVAILGAVFSVLKDVEYLRQFESETGFVLEFSANVGGEKVFGVDILEFNQEGKITDLMVMMRPANVVMKLSEEVGQILATS